MVSNLETAIMSADLTRHHIPIETEEEKRVGDDKEKQQDFLIGQIQSDLSSLSGHLFGANGSKGVLERIEDSLNGVLKGQEEIKDDISCMNNQHLADVARIEAKTRENEKDINKVADMIRAKKKRWEGISDKAIAAIVALIIGGLFSLLILGVKVSI